MQFIGSASLPEPSRHVVPVHLMLETSALEVVESELVQTELQPLSGIEGCAPAPAAGFPPPRHASYAAT
jgi:hypothetical protein